jgi:hypothetical protein
MDPTRFGAIIPPPPDAYHVYVTNLYLAGQIACGGEPVIEHLAPDLVEFSELPNSRASHPAHEHGLHACCKSLFGRPNIANRECVISPIARNS